MTIKILSTKIRRVHFLKFLLPIVTSSTRSPYHDFTHAIINLFPRHNIDACVFFIRIHGRFCWPPSFPCELTNSRDRITKPAGKNRTHPWRPKPNCLSVDVISQRTHRDFLKNSFRRATSDSRSIPRKSRQCQTKHIRRLRDIVSMEVFERTTRQIERIVTIIFTETQFFDNRRQKVFSSLKIRTITLKDRARKRCSNHNIQTHLPILIRQGINLKPVSQDNRIGSPCREREHLACLPLAGHVKIIHSLLHPKCELGDFICKILQILFSVVAKCDKSVGFPKVIFCFLQTVT